MIKHKRKRATTSLRKLLNREEYTESELDDVMLDDGDYNQIQLEKN